MSTIGLNSKEIKRFAEFIIKANSKQLFFMQANVNNEIWKRLEKNEAYTNVQLR